MHLTILTPDKELFDGHVSSVKVPGLGGQFEVLNNHAPIVAALGEGEIRVLDASGQKTVYSIKKGFIEVLKNEVSLLVQGVK